MKWPTHSHAAHMSAIAAAMRARWKTAIRGKPVSAAMWPRASQNMKRYADGLGSVV